MISELDLELFEKLGFVVLHDFIDSKTTAVIQSEMNQLETEGMFRKAAIGKGLSEHVNSTQRGDKIHWIDLESATPGLSDYIGKIQELKQDINRRFFLGLDYFECHYAEYPTGSFYTRHSDRHQSGSTRVLSLVLYLNENWKPGDGGELVLYNEDESITTVEPVAGRLAVFLSETEHEVLPTHVVRRSITGWMHHR